MLEVTHTKSLAPKWLLILVIVVVESGSGGIPNNALLKNEQEI
jgi:hypothetical protein